MSISIEQSRRTFVKIGGVAAMSLMLPEPADAGILAFLKRLAHAVGFVTGPGLLAKLWKGSGLDKSLKSAINKQLAAFQSAGLNVSDVIYQGASSSGAPGIHSVLGADQAAQTGRLIGQDPVIIRASNGSWPNHAGLFFNQAAPEAHANCIALRGPSIDAVQLASEHFALARGIDPSASPDLIQQVLLPLQDHKLRFDRSFDAQYNDPDFYDSPIGRVAIFYAPVKDAGILLVNVEDKSSKKIVYSRQFRLHPQELGPDGFKLNHEAPDPAMVKAFLKSI